MVPFIRRQTLKLRTGVLPPEEIDALQEQLAGFLCREVCDDKGTFYDKENMERK